MGHPGGFGRGGHQLVNSLRQAGEFAKTSDRQNIVQTSHFREDITSESVFSDFYLENTSFLKLDHIGLAYRFSLKKGALRLSLSAQNLCTRTKYTGLDPEPRLESDGDALLTGVERGDTYLRRKSWTIGLEFNL